MELEGFCEGEPLSLSRYHQARDWYRDEDIIDADELCSPEFGDGITHPPDIEDVEWGDHGGPPRGLRYTDDLLTDEKLEASFSDFDGVIHDGLEFFVCQ